MLGKFIATVSVVAAGSLAAVATPALASQAPVQCNVTYAQTPGQGSPGSVGSVSTTSETMTCGVWKGPATYTIRLYGGRYPTVVETVFDHETTGVFVPQSIQWNLARGNVLDAGQETTSVSVPGLVPYNWLPRITVTKTARHRH